MRQHVIVNGCCWCRVTEDNKREYVNLVARHRMTTAIKPQINSFLDGFWDLVPKVSPTPIDSAMLPSCYNVEMAAVFAFCTWLHVLVVVVISVLKVLE